MLKILQKGVDVMLSLGMYTKEQIAEEINYHTNKTSNITKKLTSLGYRYSTSGRGQTYRIYITALPQTTIRSFAEEHLGISARFEDNLSHFLYLLFATGLPQFANMSPSSLQWYTPSCKNTIQNWINCLLDCGLLVEEECVPAYYATIKEKTQVNNETGDYKYTQKWKEITREEYDKAIAAYSDTYSFGAKDIDTNPDLVMDELIYYANRARKEALEGWWANFKKPNYSIVINSEWERYDELLSLLEEYKFYNFTLEKDGNLYEDAEMWEKRFAEWEEEKQKKRQKQEEEKNIEVKEQPAKEKTETDTNATDKIMILKDTSDMPVFTDVREALKYLQKNYINDGGLREYE